MIRSYIFGVAMPCAAASLIASGTAWACYIPGLGRLAGETNEVYRARALSISKRDWLDAQVRFRDQASAIALVGLTRLEPTPSRAYGQTTKARVTQVSLLKGNAPGRDFFVKPDGTMFCGSGADDLARRKPGASFVVFMRPGRPGNKTLIKAIALGQLTDPILRVLLDKR